MLYYKKCFVLSTIDQIFNYLLYYIIFCITDPFRLPNRYKANVTNSPDSWNSVLNKTTITLDGVNIDLIPWINSENYDETIEFIKNSKSQVLFGHLEIDGFAMYKGYVAGSGLSRKIFNRYEVVCSGHYHHPYLNHTDHLASHHLNSID